MRCWRRNDDSTKTNPGCYVFPYQEDAADHRTGPEPPRAAHPVSWAAASSPPVAPFPSACSPFPLGVARAFASGCSSDLEPLPPPGLIQISQVLWIEDPGPRGRAETAGWVGDGKAVAIEEGTSPEGTFKVGIAPPGRRDEREGDERIWILLLLHMRIRTLFYKVV